MVSTNKKSKVESTQTMPVLELHWRVLVKIVQTIGSLRAESGGALGGNDGEMEVSRYHFDRSSRTSGVTYTPDHDFLNRLFRIAWNPRGIRFRGFVHSHPGYMGRPSHGDKIYAERILNAMDDLDTLWLPIVNTIPNTGRFQLTPWAARRARRGVTIESALVQVVGHPQRPAIKVSGELLLGRIRKGTPQEMIVAGQSRHFTPIAKASLANPDRERRLRRESKAAWCYGIEAQYQAMKAHKAGRAFDRVRDAYDLPRMHHSRVVVVGVGGGAEYAETLSRAGVGQFVLIDPDDVTEPNLATQQVYRRDIGRPKVDCVAERIRDINPTTSTVALKKMLNDLSDDEIRRFSFDPIDERRPLRTVICGLTDDFYAQARVNRLALELGLPSLCAQVYKEGRGAEVTFTYPGVTPACHRCVLCSRYRYFLVEGGKNEVTSHGTPIFATSRLNAIKGFVTLALLHHGSDHPRWGGLLSRIGNRNLIQVRLDPDIARTVGIGVFDKVLDKADHERLFFDETVWLPQDAESPEMGHEACPDCGGTGDLRSVEGRLGDTRRELPVGSVGEMRREQ